MNEFMEVTQATFDDEVLKSKVSVLVEFTSPTCGPCKQIVAALKDIAPEYGDEVRIVQVDVSVSMELAKQCEIQSVPTILVYQRGEISHRLIGNLTRSKLAELLDTLVEGEA